MLGGVGIAGTILTIIFPLIIITVILLTMLIQAIIHIMVTVVSGVGAIVDPTIMETRLLSTTTLAVQIETTAPEAMV